VQFLPFLRVSFMGFDMDNGSSAASRIDFFKDSKEEELSLRLLS
jgi:hypothetical protein